MCTNNQTSNPIAAMSEAANSGGLAGLSDSAIFGLRASGYGIYGDAYKTRALNTRYTFNENDWKSFQDNYTPEQKAYWGVDDATNAYKTNIARNATNVWDVARPSFSLIGSASGYRVINGLSSNAASPLTAGIHQRLTQAAGTTWMDDFDNEYVARGLAGQQAGGDDANEKWHVALAQLVNDMVAKYLPNDSEAQQYQQAVLAQQQAIDKVGTNAPQAKVNMGGPVMGALTMLAASAITGGAAAGFGASAAVAGAAGGAVSGAISEAGTPGGNIGRGLLMGAVKGAVGGFAKDAFAGFDLGNLSTEYLNAADAAGGLVPEFGTHAAYAQGIGVDQTALAGFSGFEGVDDPIEFIDRSLRVTGKETATEAAQHLGYSNVESMIGSVNPAWLSETGLSAAGLKAPSNKYNPLEMKNLLPAASAAGQFGMKLYEQEVTQGATTEAVSGATPVALGRGFVTEKYDPTVVGKKKTQPGGINIIVGVGDTALNIPSKFGFLG